MREKNMTVSALILLCGLWSLATTAWAQEYTFVVSNAAHVTCQPLEIKILNNGQQVASAFSQNPLAPGLPAQTMKLKADYCTQIQFKTLCGGQNNFHTRGCASGTVVILSPTEMN